MGAGNCGVPLSGGKWLHSTPVTIITAGGGAPTDLTFLAAALSWQEPVIAAWEIELTANTFATGGAPGNGMLGQTFIQFLATLLIMGGDSSYARYNCTQGGATLRVMLKQCFGRNYADPPNQGTGVALATLTQRIALAVEIPWLWPKGSITRWPLRPFYYGGLVKQTANLTVGQAAANQATAASVSITHHCYIIDEKQKDSKERLIFFDTPWVSSNFNYPVNGRIFSSELYSGLTDENAGTTLGQIILNSTTLDYQNEDGDIFIAEYERLVGIRFADPAGATLPDDPVALGFAQPVVFPRPQQNMFEMPDINPSESGGGGGGQVNIQTSVSPPNTDSMVTFIVLEAKGSKCIQQTIGAPAYIKTGSGALAPAVPSPSLTERDIAMLATVPASYVSGK